MNQLPKFNLRHGLCYLFEYYLDSKMDFESIWLDENEFFLMMLAKHIKKPNSLKINSKEKTKIKNFQLLFKKVILKYSDIVSKSPQKTLIDLYSRSKILNTHERITGNSITLVVDSILWNKETNMNNKQVQKIMDLFIDNYSQNPDKKMLKPRLVDDSGVEELLQHLKSIIIENNEDI